MEDAAEGQGVGEMVAQIMALLRGGGAEVETTATTTISMEVPDVVLDAAVVVTAEQEGGVEVHHLRLHHPLGPLLPCWTRTFSLVSSSAPLLSDFSA